jgi:hypothetical protein
VPDSVDGTTQDPISLADIIVHFSYPVMWADEDYQVFLEIPKEERLRYVSCNFFLSVIVTSVSVLYLVTGLRTTLLNTPYVLYSALVVALILCLIPVYSFLVAIYSIKKKLMATQIQPNPTSKPPSRGQRNREK